MPLSTLVRTLITAAAGSGSGWYIWKYREASISLSDDNDAVKEEYIVLPKTVEYVADELNRPKDLSSLFLDYLKSIQRRCRVAKRNFYLKLAASNHPVIRKKGVEGLVSLEHLTEDDFSYIWRNLKPEAAVYIARMKEADCRLFAPPPPLPLHFAENNSEDLLIEVLRELPVHQKDDCVRYFTELALKHGASLAVDEQRDVHGLDGLDFNRLPQLLPKEKREFLLLNAVHGHSKREDGAQTLMERGILQLLQKMVTQLPNQDHVKHISCKVLANLALIPTCREEIHRSGWIGLLARLQRSESLLVNLPAMKALINLEYGQPGCVHLHDGIYIFHPPFRESRTFAADLVFVHGLNGGAFKTWRQKDPDTPCCDFEQTMCWPRDWLAEDLPLVRMIGVDYESYLSQWAPICPYDSDKRSQAPRAEAILSSLVEAGLGSRPIVWISHSMGGLLVKRMLLLARDHPQFRSVFDRTLGIIFFSTPHRGSYVASLSSQMRYLLIPSIEVLELINNSSELLKLNQDFAALIGQRQLASLSFGELRKTHLSRRIHFEMVPLDSSDPGFGQFIPLDTNHRDVCKPRDKSNFIYVKTLSFIKSLFSQ